MTHRHRMFTKHKLYKEWEERFFQQVQEGHSYKFYEGHYTYHDLERAALRYGIRVRYNKPGSLEYKYMGCFSFKVLKKLDSQSEDVKKDEEQKPLYFDVNQLAI